MIIQKQRRKRTRVIRLGDLRIGGSNPIVVQGMTKTPTDDVRSTVAQIRRMEALGCEAVRIAIPDAEAAQAFARIRKQISMSIIADIHFRAELALCALDAGADCVRINPGNMGGRKPFEKVVKAAAASGAALRIGVNEGSMEKDLLKKHGGPSAAALAESALRWTHAAEEFEFRNFKVSVKASDVPRTVAAYREVSKRSNVPLHIGITESGGGRSGVVRSSVGVGILLAEGIGDTLRVSLTGPPGEEIRVAWDILGSLNIRRRGPIVISCPTCGRCRGPLAKIHSEVSAAVADLPDVVTIAVMGCEVNGPGEAAGADFAVVMGARCAYIYMSGQKILKTNEANAAKILLSRIRKETQNK
jgi:(E)-4-hydroxy-3-methylbut-2-enyl-diphosphate synthase